MKTTGLSIALLALVALGCNRKDDDNTTPAEIGGKGGSAVLKITPRHHGVQIDSCMVYIKYNSHDAAATYDDSARCVQVNGVPVATFSGLKNGNYYLYGYGYDPSILEVVKGGSPYVISSQTTLNLDLAVTE